MVSAVVGELKFPNSSTHALATGHINTQRADHTPACLSQCTNNHPDHRSCAHLQAHLEKHAVQPFLTSLTSCLTMVLRFFFLPPQPDNPSNALWMERLGDLLGQLELSHLQRPQGMALTMSGREEPRGGANRLLGNMICGIHDTHTHAGISLLAPSPAWRGWVYPLASVKDSCDARKSLKL